MKPARCRPRDKIPPEAFHAVYRRSRAPLRLAVGIDLRIVQRAGMLSPLPGEPEYIDPVIFIECPAVDLRDVDEVIDVGIVERLKDNAR